MQQAVGCWSTEHCGAVLPGLVFLAVSHEFWLFKGKVQHWEGRHTTAPRSLQHSQFWVMGVSCSLRFQSEHLAVRSENPSLPCVRFITCNSYFMSLYYILLLFGVNLFSLPILIGLFLFSFPPPKKGAGSWKGAREASSPSPHCHAWNHRTFNIFLHCSLTFYHCTYKVLSGSMAYSTADQ